MKLGSVISNHLVQISSPQGGEPENLLSMTNGLFWTPSAAGNKVLNLTIAGGTGLEYLAGVGPQGFNSVTLDNGNGFVVTVPFSWNGAFYINLDPLESYQNCTLTFTGQGVLYGICVGNDWDVPNGGEQAGYAKGYLARSLSLNSVVDKSAIPVATVGTRKAAKGKLQIKNMPMSEIHYWNMLQITTESWGGFFIQEVDEDETTGYWVFDVKFDTPKAHGSTRKLAVCSVGFNIYNGV